MLFILREKHMKNSLLVTAHPYSESFNFALRNQTVELLHKHDWQISTSDLYQQGFSPALSPADFPNIAESVPLSLLKQQESAHQHMLFSHDISIEQRKLLAADLVILQFPLWWGSYPAILKGWIERVISYGYAYGNNNLLSGKKVLLSVTTGGANDDNEMEYYQKKIHQLGVDVFSYVKMEILNPIIIHGPSHSNEKKRHALLARSKKQLLRMLNT